MSKDTKKPRKSKQNVETKTPDPKPSVSNEDLKRRTRMSNIKEEGFYNFKNMMIRNVKSQAEGNGRVSKKAKKRVKSKRAQK